MNFDINAGNDLPQHRANHQMEAVLVDGKKDVDNTSNPTNETQNR